MHQKLNFNIIFSKPVKHKDKIYPRYKYTQLPKLYVILVQGIYKKQTSQQSELCKEISKVVDKEKFYASNLTPFTSLTCFRYRLKGFSATSYV